MLSVDLGGRCPVGYWRPAGAATDGTFDLGGGFATGIVRRGGGIRAVILAEAVSRGGVRSGLHAPNVARVMAVGMA